MFESRCGVRCNICERKEKVNCKGCLRTHTHGNKRFNKTEEKAI